eukprot:3382214-Amphidinium_carterae.1
MERPARLLLHEPELTFLKDRGNLNAPTPEWQLVVGKQGRQGHCDEFSPAATRFPLVCTNRLVVLERALNIDEEKFFFVCKVGRRTSFHGEQ